MTTETNTATMVDVASKTPKHANVGWYAELLGNWQVKLMGAKPTAEQLSIPLYWGYRAGLEALHIAMCLRPEGCTVQQFCTAGSCGPANNKRRDVTTHRKLATVTVSGTPYAYKLVLTAKGREALKAGIAKAAEPATDKSAKATKKAKAKVNAKGRSTSKPKAKAKPAPYASTLEALEVPEVPRPEVTNNHVTA